MLTFELKAELMISFYYYLINLKMNEDAQMSNGDSSVKPTTKIQELFGGAFRIDKFPSTFRDISDIVPISDN